MSYHEIKQKSRKGFYGKLACLASKAKNDHFQNKATIQLF
jgi:hypothetical protein